ncbi:DUF58 domain-containing protein [Cerasicoccus fimbriatus]|uniref:DUF58 domain-containing protein n=1 Tax=Cerasicoccus fimbriatus TaxID=3014554 RepID=UPI0022B5D64C|nr:DUF58 domain-containing protein [Cerasicoccus sp. TK19100]
MKFAPTNRLVLFAALLCPAALLAPMNGGLLAICAVLYALLFVFALVDWLAGRKLLRDIRVEAAAVTRMSLGNPGKVELFIRREGADEAVFQLALGLDQSLEPTEDKLPIRLDQDGEFWSTLWPVTPRRRGIYHVDAVYAETASRFGLWTFRHVFPTKAEIRVYPNLRRDRQQLANLFLNRGTIGTHIQRIMGQGRDYEQLREYLPGDSMMDIHWKATAKRNEPVTKTYQIERTREIYLIVDHSRLSGRIVAEGQNGGPDESALERFLTVTSILNLVAGRQGDLFGLVTFSHQVTNYLRASSGRGHQQCVQDALFDLQSDRTTPDFDELFSFLRMRLRRRALLIFLTDLSDPSAADSFAKSVRMITRQHLVLANMIVGEEIGPLFRPKVEPRSAEDIYGLLSGHLRWHGLSELSRNLRQGGVDLALLPENNLAVEIVNQYLRVKQRQLI